MSWGHHDFAVHDFGGHDYDTASHHDYSHDTSADHATAPIHTSHPNAASDTYSTPAYQPEPPHEAPHHHKHHNKPAELPDVAYTLFTGTLFGDSGSGGAAKSNAVATPASLQVAAPSHPSKNEDIQEKKNNGCCCRR